MGNLFGGPVDNCVSSPVIGADLSYFFFKHRAIVLGSGAIGEIWTLQKPYLARQMDCRDTAFGVSSIIPAQAELI
ncbi:hypothetical protein [Microcoleus sp. herbarium14]|uniref:hypothetical protein n=1 Tax=Microcoleus sp. herbarium14 TaxID=3055439 RepID=UPI002FCF4EA4